MDSTGLEAEDPIVERISKRIEGGVKWEKVVEVEVDGRCRRER